MPEADKHVHSAQKTVQTLKARQRIHDKPAAGEVAEHKRGLWEARLTH